MSIPESAFDNWKNVSDLIRDKRKKDGLSAQELADIIGVKATNIYKWENGSRPIDLKIYNKVLKWLASETGIKSIPVGKNTLVEEDDREYRLKKESPSLEVILNISDSNKILVQSNKTIAESNHILAKNNEELISMLKTTAYGGQQTSPDVAAKFSGFLELLAQVGSGKKKWKSIEEARAELNKLILVPGENG
jgi:transcriptional regulator with XRE-family HTH domain